ncbi:MAG: diadenylate cyclase [Puniceicoccales bacterium]|jgi:DNA integrity scanning protein DisA with diadenylate cyclase activity/mannitol/fructose-specific phosphotransferase system IIA component (Ntr-type)|nr:diadenylate cyclase [Puniceicoccales bacterium]
MKIERFLSTRRIIDLKSRNFRDAIRELLTLCPAAVTAPPAAPAGAPPSASATTDPAAAPSRLDSLLEEILQRGRLIPMRVDNSVAFPNVRLPMRERYVFAIGRCPEGLPDSPEAADRSVRILFLVLVSDKNSSAHGTLSALTDAFGDKATVERLENASSLSEFRAGIANVFKGVGGSAAAFNSRLNQLFLREAEKIGLAAGCTSLLLFLDTFSSPPPVPAKSPRGLAIIPVSERPQNLPDTREPSSERDNADRGERDAGAAKNPPGAPPSIIQIRAFSQQRFSQLRSALLVALTRGRINSGDRVCCVGGLPGSDKFDVLLVVDMAGEFPSVLSRHASDLLPADVKPEVFERALGIATELAVEGREGKPVGCILVIGNHRQIKAHVKPLILNPFHGYPAADRNILSPFMDETVKELSSIDGAFIINGDGAIESAGSMLTAHEFQDTTLPGGLGTRHMAAAAITNTADCVTIVVSSSTGQVTLFRRGEPLVLMDRSSKRRSL